MPSSGISSCSGIGGRTASATGAVGLVLVFASIALLLAARLAGSGLLLYDLPEGELSQARFVAFGGGSPAEWTGLTVRSLHCYATTRAAPTRTSDGGSRSRRRPSSAASTASSARA